MSGHGLAIAIAVVLVGVTVALAVYASRQLGGTGDHYVAGGRLRGWQNGIALAGDQISAGSFLGITGAVALTGFSGFYLAAGLPAAYLLILLLVAEPLRNLVARRHDRRHLHPDLQGVGAARARSRADADQHLEDPGGTLSARCCTPGIPSATRRSSPCTWERPVRWRTSH
jgi:Sodium:solute symporter family